MGMLLPQLSPTERHDAKITSGGSVALGSAKSDPQILEHFFAILKRRIRFSAMRKRLDRS
jgi:hypothetical protein